MVKPLIALWIVLALVLWAFGMGLLELVVLAAVALAIAGYVAYSRSHTTSRSSA